MNEKIFKAYDIRGVYPEEINEDAAYLIGRAFVQFLGCKSVVVGQDMRLSSPSLFEALARGITDQGATVIKIGMVATPMLSFAVMKWGEPAGIMISASHNPGKYNAFKLIKNGGKFALQIHDGNGIKDIRDLAKENKFETVAEKGNIVEKSIQAEYEDRLKMVASGVSNLKVVADYGNGVGSISAKNILASMAIGYTGLYDQPDGSFPNHEANPQEIANLDDLKQAVIEQKADLGIFFDGDADRSVIVDEQGQIIFPDVALGILASKELEKNPGENVFYDLRFTKAVAEELQKKGGKPMMLRVGNPFYKEAFLKDGGIIAGELSGHIMFAENFAIDDGFFAALKFMAVMYETGKKASELAMPFQKYFQTEEINMEVADADKTIESVKEKYSDGNLNTIDGIVISYADWWLSLRKSNTEPIVRLRLEADFKELLEEKRAELLQLIKGE